MNYFETKKYVKNKISALNNYTIGEEDFLLQEAFLEENSKLILRDFCKKDIKKIDKIIKERLKEKPLNKIFKHCFFYKDDFYINNYVLAPRKETEILVENAIKIANNFDKECVKVLDLCCGSGIIGLSVAKHSVKNCFVVLSDISKKALKITKKNIKSLKLENCTKVIKSNLFNHLKQEEKFDIILCNPPYIKSSDIKLLDKGVAKYDPLLALDGGKDGLDFYKKICNKGKKYLNENGIVVVEIGYNQKKDVENLFNKNNFTTICLRDYSNNNRVIIATKKENKK